MFFAEYCPCLQWAGNYGAALQQSVRKKEHGAEGKGEKLGARQAPSKRPKLEGGANHPTRGCYACCCCGGLLHVIWIKLWLI
jgi:hypothetical protein